MSSYLHGVHDAGGAVLMADKPGWIVVTEAIGSDPNDNSSQDYSRLSKQGFSVLVRLNNGYKPAGTYPLQDKYNDFAQRCAHFVKGCRGAAAFIIGNEPNHEQERPAGVPITPQMAAACFNACYKAIKSVAVAAIVLAPPVAPWDNTTVYAGNQSGDWLVYYRHMLEGIVECDGLTLHAYTHGSEPGLVRDRTVINGWFWHMPVFEQQLAIVPPSRRHLPVHITEINQGDVGWVDENRGWVREAYAYVDEWNRKPGTQKILSLSLFRWQHFQGQRWDIETRMQVREDFKAAVATGYPRGDTYVMNGNKVYLPAVGKDDAPDPGALPMREIDERAERKGTRIEPVFVDPGQKFWRVQHIYTPDEAESDKLGPDHHVLANVYVDGEVQIDTKLLATWGGGGTNETATITTKTNKGYPWTADLGLSPGDFTLMVDPASGFPSERVTGIKMGWWDSEGRWNPGAHTSTLIHFSLETMPSHRPQNAPPQDGREERYDAPRIGKVVVKELRARSGPGIEFGVLDNLRFGDIVEATKQIVRGGYTWIDIGSGKWVASEYVAWDGDIDDLPATPGDTWERSWPIVLRIEGGLSLDPNDKGNWYNGKLVGTKYGISARVWGDRYDIPNLTKAQALDIYHEHYWNASGANREEWPLCLVLFDTAVNHGVDVARTLLRQTPTREQIYLGLRSLRYFQDPMWPTYGIAWGSRVGHLDDIVRGEIRA